MEQKITDSAAVTLLRTTYFNTIREYLEKQGETICITGSATLKIPVVDCNSNEQVVKIVVSVDKPRDGEESDPYTEADIYREKQELKAAKAEERKRAAAERAAKAAERKAAKAAKKEAEAEGE